jgi:hypothetical protein
MKNLSKFVVSAVTAVALAFNVIATAAAPPHAAPVTLNFEKCLADANTGLFTGTVRGECGDGSVVYETIVLEPGNPGVRLEGLYHITTASCSFTAHCSGQANTHNGVIVLNGEVTADSANFAGAQVKVRAQLIVGENSLCSAGTITLTPTK